MNEYRVEYQGIEILKWLFYLNVSTANNDSSSPQYNLDNSCIVEDNKINENPNKKLIEVHV